MPIRWSAQRSQNRYASSPIGMGGGSAAQQTIPGRINTAQDHFSARIRRRNCCNFFPIVLRFATPGRNCVLSNSRFHLFRRISGNCIYLSLLLPVFMAVSVSAQTVDTAILGTVTDAGGAVVPSGTVTLTQQSTGLSRNATTANDGTYEFRYLLPGEYTVEVKANGFNTERRAGVTLQLGQQAKVDFTLNIGTVQQTIEVNAAPPLLQTENASLGNVVGPERIENLPLNGRKFDDLAILTPGVQVYNPDLHSSSTDGSEIGGNGGRLIWGQVNVDGITMVNNRHNYVNLYPSVDAIQEFRVQTGNYSAEYGGNAGTNVNIQIKSGTNRFHGDLFEYLRNSAMDARNYFTP